MTAVVTGASGFLGRALVTELIKRHQSVRILARDEKKARQLFGNAVTIIPGEITDAAQVQQAAEGATTIYHLAGRLYHPSTSAALYHEKHVEGTRVLLQACLGQTQLQRIVHVSTTGVHGITGDSPVAKDTPFAPTNLYEATKLEGELLALRTYQEQGLPVTVARPGLVYRPGDLHLLGFFVAIKKGLFRVIDGGKALLHPVYIDDLVAALLLCVGCLQATGRSYNIEHAQGRELPAASMPSWLANLASDVFAVMPSMKGERAPLTRSRVKFLTNSRIYDITRARSELGYAPKVGLEEGMKLTASWYYKHHYLDN